MGGWNFSWFFELDLFSTERFLQVENLEVKKNQSKYSIAVKPAVDQN